MIILYIYLYISLYIYMYVYIYLIIIHYICVYLCSYTSRVHIYILNMHDDALLLCKLFYLPTGRYNSVHRHAQRKNMECQENVC